MSRTLQTITIKNEIDLEPEIELDDAGVLQLVICIFTNEEDEEEDYYSLSFNEIIEAFIEDNKNDPSRESYGGMYQVAHALREAADQVLRAAERQEDTLNGQGTFPVNSTYSEQ